MNIISTTLLMAQGNGAAGSPPPWINIALFGGIIIVFYLFMMRPQQKKASDAKKFLENLQKGDKIVTVAGIHGRINKINENGTIEVEIDNNVKIVMERAGISMEYTKQLQDRNKAS